MSYKKPLILLVCAALLALIVKYSDALLQAIQLLFALLTPIFLGCAIAYVLNLLIVRLERLPFLARQNSPVYRFRRGISLAGALVIIAAVLVLLVWIILPQLGDALRVMLLGIPPLLDEFSDWLGSLGNPTPQIEQWLNTLDINWPQFVQKAMSYLSSGMGSLFSSAVSIVSNVSAVVMQVVIAFIFALYLLAGKEHLAAQCRSVAQTYLSGKTYRRMLYLLSTANDTFSKFFIGQFTEAIVIGVLCTLGMLLFRFPYANIIGVVVGVTSLVPLVGSFVGIVIGAMLTLTVDPLKALLFIVFVLCLQQVEGNLIYPKVVGKAVGLPGVIVLSAVLVGTNIAGIIGGLCAVPISAILYTLLREAVNNRISHRVGPGSRSV